ncbi:MAG: hypothetical protein CFE43_17895 [Burkholderiales bacterium PBB3]|nr:MAG: hypothetical protein CFE43_17895 [Burkholderiales bacterium PBB3]
MRSESIEAGESRDAATAHLPAQEQCDRTHMQRLDLVAWALLIGGSMFLLLVTGLLMYLMDLQGDETVAYEQPAGKVLAVRSMGGLVASTLVETTLGFYAVSGGIGLSKADELILQTRANRRRYLCDTSQRCMPLL